MTQIFLDESHVYHDAATGRVIPGTTSVLQDYIKFEIAGDKFYLHRQSGQVISAWIMERAAAFGTAFHQGAKYLITGQGINWSGLNPILEPALRRFDVWRRENVAEVLLCEQPMYSRRYDYAGTPDLVCRLVSSKKRHIALIDFKTGLYGASVEAQVAAYEQLYRENYGYKGFIDRHVLYVSRDGEQLDFVAMADKTAFQYFLNKLHAYRWEQGRKAA